MSFPIRPVAAHRLLAYVFLFVLSLIVFVPVMTVASKRNLRTSAIHIRFAEALPHEVSYMYPMFCIMPYILIDKELASDMADSSDIALVAIIGYSYYLFQ